MNVSKLNPGDIVAMATQGSHPELGCDPVIFCGIDGRRAIVTTSIDGDLEHYAENPQEAVSLAERTMRQYYNGNSNVYDRYGFWVVTFKAIPCLWENYETWQAGYAKRSAAGQKAYATKLKNKSDAMLAEYAAKRAARPRPIQDMEEMLNKFVGMSHCYVRQIRDDDEGFDAEDTVIVSMHLTFKNWRALEQFVSRGQKAGIFKDRPVKSGESK